MQEPGTPPLQAPGSGVRAEWPHSPRRAPQQVEPASGATPALGFSQRVGRDGCHAFADPVSQHARDARRTSKPTSRSPGLGETDAWSPDTRRAPARHRWTGWDRVPVGVPQPVTLARMGHRSLRTPWSLAHGQWASVKNSVARHSTTAPTVAACAGPQSPG